ncbi:MAG: EF-hand domain-containing protein [Candidatus Gastranaerophilales bacterium]|nr:EF-hand domain-containing protein [Candidatus Gastranaerophilales bacterium]
MSSSSLFTGITSGLTNTYSILARASAAGVTASSISSTMSNSQYASSLNPTFASYILSNFTSLDKDGDGVLGAGEISALTNSINTTGVTSSQLSQLGTASGLSGETLQQVLEHFSEIDANGDGKVTSAEISAFKLTSAMEKKKTEFANKAAANQSVFYGDENASTKNDSSSMLSFKYWNDGNNSSS